MKSPEVVEQKLRQHSRLKGADLAAVRSLRCRFQTLEPNEDFICQGEVPTESAIVVEGMVARYHTVAKGSRQYLSFHIAGDWPDAQGLFLETMDHSVCAIGRTVLCAITHQELMRVFNDRPAVGYAVWRETLIDAAIFREAVTNNSSRSGVARLAHFFCEVYFKSKAMDLLQGESCALQLSQRQIGEALGMSIATVFRHLQELRRTGQADLRTGRLTVKSFSKLAELGEFDPLYLHPRVQDPH